MVYCFNFLNFHIKRIQLEIDRAKEIGAFIYYDEENDIFLDMDNREVNVEGLDVVPVSGLLQLPKMIEALSKQGASIPNSYDDILMIEDWYKYIETNRNLVPFKGKNLEDDTFLSYLIETFGDQNEVFLKTVKKDFNGIVKVADLINKDSDLRQAFSYHLEDDFIISNKVNIDKDNLGPLEYRAFIMNNRIMNISRITDEVYHSIPVDVLKYYQSILKELPSDFPYSYVLDVFSHDGVFDILEFNPIEGSGKYLYNSIFEYSNDLTHKIIENIPVERDKDNLNYGPFEDKSPSTTDTLENSFAKDYSDIKRFGERIEGTMFIHGLPSDTKINIREIFENSRPLLSDDEIVVDFHEEQVDVEQIIREANERESKIFTKKK